MARRGCALEAACSTQLVKATHNWVASRDRHQHQQQHANDCEDDDDDEEEDADAGVRLAMMANKEHTCMHERVTRK